MSATAAAPGDARPTIWGLGMFAITLAIAGSAFQSLRIEVGDLQVHPSLIPLGIAFGFSLPRVARVPARLLGSLAAFAALYAVSTLAEGFQVGEVAKLTAACVMIVAAAAIPRRPADVTAGVLGMVLAVGIISLHGLASVDTAILGANPLEEIANKNAFSIYALPSLLLGGFYLLKPDGSKFTKFAIAGTSIVIIVTVFSTGNRSGWAGVFLIVLMLLMVGPSRLGELRGVAVVFLIGAISYTAFQEWGTAEVVDHRMEQTMSGYRSDNYRLELFAMCMEIGLENPILGISPKGLGQELARRSVSELGTVDPHNVLGHVFAGSGLLTLFAMLWVGSCLWTPFPEERGIPVGGRALLRMLIVLWLARGMFTREVLYSPTFCIGMGLALAMILHARSRTGASVAAPMPVESAAATSSS